MRLFGSNSDNGHAKAMQELTERVETVERNLRNATLDLENWFGKIRTALGRINSLERWDKSKGEPASNADDVNERIRSTGRP